MIGRTNADGGIGIDEDLVTAVPYNVLSDKVFYGVGSDEPQKGTMPNKIGVTYRHNTINDSTANMGNVNSIKSGGTDESLIINVTPPAGFYDGNTSKLDIRIWGVHEKFVKYGARIGYPNNTGLVGSYTGDANATAADLLSPKTMYVKGQKITGNIITRGTVNPTLSAGSSYTISPGYYTGGKVTAKTLASQTSGTATAGHIFSGKTAWVNGNKITGTMTVNSILNFSAAAYSGRQVLLKWQNPNAAAGKPFSGVCIKYSTSAYPGTVGFKAYIGVGDNTSPGGWSQTIIRLPNLKTTYYFSCYAYATCSLGTIYDTKHIWNATTTTSDELWETFTSSQSYIIPQGYSKADFFCVGGGAGGGKEIRDVSNTGYTPNAGGGGGYTETFRNIGVSGGESFYVVIGAGGEKGKAGGETMFFYKTLYSVKGGLPPRESAREGGSGGSGGGEGGWGSSINPWHGADGGSDGSNGKGLPPETITYIKSGRGQGRTTRAWDDAGGTLYSGGGGGCGGASIVGYKGHGGDGGGGDGYDNTTGDFATDGAVNTGGGGGGGTFRNSIKDVVSGSGGSGIVLLHLY